MLLVKAGEIDLSTITRNGSAHPLVLALQSAYPAETIRKLLLAYPGAAATKISSGSYIYPLQVALAAKSSVEVLQMLLQEHPAAATRRKGW